MYVTTDVHIQCIHAFEIPRMVVQVLLVAHWAVPADNVHRTESTDEFNDCIDYDPRDPSSGVSNSSPAFHVCLWWFVTQRSWRQELESVYWGIVHDDKNHDDQVYGFPITITCWDDPNACHQKLQIRQLEVPRFRKELSKVTVGGHAESLQSSAA